MTGFSVGANLWQKKSRRAEGERLYWSVFARLTGREEEEKIKCTCGWHELKEEAKK